MRCLLYARVSTDKQAQKDLSIPAQLQLMREHAKRQGWSIVGQYIDEGESARTADRPELKRLLRYCQKTKGVDVVLVHKLDRLARSVYDYAAIKAIFKRHGIRLVSVSEPFDEGPVGQLMENIIASISEWYSANLGEEIKKAASTKLQRGEWPLGPPVGYRSVRDAAHKVRHVEDPVTAPLVRQAFDLYATREYSLKELGEEMAERGLRTRLGKPYSPEMLKRLLMRRFYIGKLVWNGREYRGTHPPLIPKALFYQVQEVLRARHADTGEKGRLSFLLRGVAVCRTCGGKLTAERHPKGQYYRCPAASRCGEPYVPVRLLEGQLEALYDRLQPPERILRAVKWEIEAIALRRQAVAEKELVSVRQTLKSVEAKELKLVDELVGGRVSRDLYEKLSERYRKERQAAEARLAQLEVDYGDPLDFLDKCLVVASTARALHERFAHPQRKMLLRALFRRLHVHDRAIVGVELNPPFSFFLGEAAGRLFEDPPSGKPPGAGSGPLSRLPGDSSGMKDRIRFEDPPSVDPRRKNRTPAKAGVRDEY